MNWVNAADFFAMGGYGLYVWGSFGMVALCLVAEVAQLAARRAAARREAATAPWEGESA